MGAADLTEAEGRLRVYLAGGTLGGAVARPGAIAAALRFGGRSFLHGQARVKVRSSS